ncbi:MAG: CehA/McbA family metallohydrolase, partial [Myxococcales bacterium]
FVAPRMQVLLSFLGMTLLGVGDATIPAGREARLSMHLLVGNGDTASLLAAKARLEGKPQPLMKVRATAAGEPVAGARVHVTDGEAYRALGRTGADGVATLPLPPGEYTVEALSDRRESSGPVQVSHTAAGSSVDAGIEPAGTLLARATESGQPIPFKLVLFREGASPRTYPRTYGEVRMPANAHWVHFAGLDGAELPLAAGRYRAVAQRGFEYDLSEQIVDVAPGQTTTLDFKLTRVVNTTGFVSADFHIHGAPSPDSDDLLVYKVLSFGAEGLEIPVSTDHETIADYEPVVRGLKLERFMKTMVGSEVTTVTFGHFNAFPMRLLDEPNNGAVRWYNKPARQIFDEVRRNPGEPLLQINHPRGGIGSGYFSMIGFDRDSFTADKQEHFFTDFDVMEVLNGARFESSEAEVQQDWFAFLRRGHRITGTGNSDSHHSLTSEVGTPRTYVEVGEDEP